MPYLLHADGRTDMSYCSKSNSAYIYNSKMSTLNKNKH